MASASDVSVAKIKQPPIPSLRTNFAWTLSGNLIYAVCQWGMIATVAKLGSATLLGQFALGQAIAAPVFLFTSLQLRGVQATDAQSEFTFADYFTLRCLATLTGMMAIGGIVLVSQYERETAVIVLLVGGSKTIEAIGDVVAGLLQKHERLDQVALSLMIRGAVSLALFAVAFRAFHSLFAAVLSLILSWTVVALSYDIRRASRLLVRGERFLQFDWGTLRRLATLSLPLGMVMAMSSLNTNLPRYVVERALGPRELGIFAALAYLVTAASLIVNALGQSAAVRLSRMFADGDADGFRRLLRKLLAFGAALGVAGIFLGWVLGRKLLAFLYTPEYANHMGAFLLMVATVGTMSVASFLGFGMTASRSFRPQVVVLLASLVATTLASITFIPRWGLMGASAALLISSAVQAAGLAVVLRKRLKILNQ